MQSTTLVSASTNTILSCFLPQCPVLPPFPSQRQARKSDVPSNFSDLPRLPGLVRRPQRMSKFHFHHHLKHPVAVHPKFQRSKIGSNLVRLFLTLILDPVAEPTSSQAHHPPRRLLRRHGHLSPLLKHVDLQSLFPLILSMGVCGRIRLHHAYIQTPGNLLILSAMAVALHC